MGWERVAVLWALLYFGMFKLFIGGSFVSSLVLQDGERNGDVLIVALRCSTLSGITFLGEGGGACSFA